MDGRLGSRRANRCQPYPADRPLLTALFILAGIVWTALDLMALHRNRLAAPARLTLLGAGAVLTLFVQLMFGALTAGWTRAMPFPAGR